MGADRRSLRVFISSPDDVVDEREAARRVVRRLGDEFRHELDLDEVMWEWQPLLAGQHFQTQIAPPHDTDITVVVLWSRLGTPLPIERFPGPITKGEVTGTEWEFEDALASMRARQTPEVLVYRKRDARLSMPDSLAALEEQHRQSRLVETFFQRWFASRPDGNVDFAVRTFRSTAEFETLVEAHLRKLVKQRLTGGATKARWHAGSPYRGLESFEPEHAEIFFGRDAANQALRERLERRLADGLPFVAVLGASGSGKSSLVKAGLIPSLARGSWVGRIGVARFAILTPAGDADPIVSLARALLSPTALPELGARGFGDAAQLANLLRESPPSAANLIGQVLRDVAAAHPPRAEQRAGLLIAVDQLEELFTTPFGDDARRGFVAVLETLARASAPADLPADSPPILVAATMRSDFYGELDRLPSLAALVEGDGQLLVLAPSEAEIGQMIRMPAELAGLRFERDAQGKVGLDDEILAVAQRDTRVLPLLSYLLNQVWERRTADGVLTFDAYRALGGLEGSLARRADEVVDAQPPEVQAALPNVLGALVHAAAARADESSSGEAGTFTARWLTLDRFPGHSPERRLIDALLAPSVRLLVAEGDRDHARVRVAHEALLTHWQRAREMLEADRSDLVLIERLEEAERLWRESPDQARTDRLLPSGLPLAEATDLLARRHDRLAREIVEFVDTSARAEHDRLRKRSRRARQLVSVFATLALVASILGVFAWRKSVEAREQGLVATRRAEDVLSLSAQRDLDDLIARADKLWPAHPEMIPAYEEWLRDARELIGGRPADPERGIRARPGLAQHKAKLAELGARALPVTDADRLAETKAHARYAELEAKRAELQWRSRMLGMESWPAEAEVEAALAAEDLPTEADKLNALAWPLVDPDAPQPGNEVRAWLLARRAVAAAGDEERGGIRDTLAWALYRLARFDEARSEEAQAVSESAAGALDAAAARLDEAIASWSDPAMAARRAELDAFADETEALAVLVGERAFASDDDAWWHAQLTELVEGLEALRDPETGLMSDVLAEPFGWGVAKRYKFGKTIKERSVTGPEASRLWAEAIAAIKASPKYGGLDITPQMGLLPIGMDPHSELWEFAHLQTGTDAGAVPERGPDGKLVLTEGMGLVFVLIPGGTFWMGAQKDDPSGQNYDPAAEPDESPVHEVDLSPYFLSKYEMTQGQWERIAAWNPSLYGPRRYYEFWNREGQGWSAMHPVEQASWTDCVDLTERLALSLPTEAQWERSARGGTGSVYWTGSDVNSLMGAANLLDAYAKSHGIETNNVCEEAFDDGNSVHARIGSFRGNGFGVHDVHGNLWEWCFDGYASYGADRLRDPLRGGGSTHRVIRGGGFDDAAPAARSAYRGAAAPAARDPDIGLRPSRTLRFPPSATHPVEWR